MMDMRSRNQYLQTLIQKHGYHTKSKKEKSRLLDEYCANTGQRRKYVIRKIRSGKYLRGNDGERKRRRAQYYDGHVREALARCWEIFDYPCGQRLAPLLKRETARLRALGELSCSDEVAGKLTRIGFRTIDEKRKHEKEVRRQRGIYHKKHHPLLYQKIPVKVFADQDREKEGNIQIDLVEHCGWSVGGEFIYTLAATDNATGWWEGEAVLGKGQYAVFEGLQKAQARFPFPWKEIHSDNGGEFINDHLYRYTLREKIGFSRSRPYKKNDNCLVEQKNWTHVRKLVGYYRYDTKEELAMLNSLYRNELRLYKNFFQPVMKLVSKERVGGNMRRRYDTPRSPYERAMESPDISQETKEYLARLYQSFNPAQLKRSIDATLNLLYQAYHAKHTKTQQKVETKKKSQPRMVTFLIAQPEPVSVT